MDYSRDRWLNEGGWEGVIVDRKEEAPERIIFPIRQNKSQLSQGSW